MSMSLPFDAAIAGAEFSEDRKYRYRLWRTWSGVAPACFLLLNPSTANETELDPTLRRCAGFARAWGYGGLVVVNLFAIVSADPRVLLTHDDAIGDVPRRTTLGRIVTNTSVLLEECKVPDVVIAGWGAFPEAAEQALRIRCMLESRSIQLHCLGITKDGHPKHPLYLHSDTKLRPFGDRQP